MILFENFRNERAAHGDDPHSSHRLKESHPHAIVFDPAHDKVAYVPDLGEACIKQLHFNTDSGKMRYLGRVSCGRPDAGPRYIEFHPHLKICYCVNELSSTILTYRFDDKVVLDLINSTEDKQDPTLSVIHEV